MARCGQQRFNRPETMSSFTITARHIDKGTLHTVWCLDDYFGKHQYGYIVDGGNALREDAFYRAYEPTDQPGGE
jgi:hypothetical protein